MPPAPRSHTYFCIVGPQDAVIFEHSVPPRDDLLLKRQFMVHSALDEVDDLLQNGANSATTDFYLSKVDKFDGTYFVSAYVGIGPVRLLLMQEQEPHSNVRTFFVNVHELCIKYLTNPFADPSKPISNRAFKERAIALFNEHF